MLLGHMIGAGMHGVFILRGRGGSEMASSTSMIVISGKLCDLVLLVTRMIGERLFLLNQMIEQYRTLHVTQTSF